MTKYFPVRLPVMLFVLRIAGGMCIINENVILLYADHIRCREISRPIVCQMNYIEPDDTHHQSFVDVEPVTGKVLRRAIRLQVLRPADFCTSLCCVFIGGGGLLEFILLFATPRFLIRSFTVVRKWTVYIQCSQA